MAAVLDALAPYAKKLIQDMAEEEVSMLLGVSGEITKMEGNLDSLRAFVSDAERRRITKESVQRWVSKLKDAMYNATDIIELCQLKADECKELEEGGSIRDQNHLLACCQPLLVLENDGFQQVGLEGDSRSLRPDKCLGRRRVRWKGGLDKIRVS
ncbi:putative disease resistance protein At1g50180 [Miscanthus floridulus]|uniref:putative disease resistance protein At1g50180 n=1 Tax=Miscanthus floridulus TaxID=154761 RepID=UPI00345877F5